MLDKVNVVLVFCGVGFMAAIAWEGIKLILRPRSVLRRFAERARLSGLELLKRNAP